MSLTPLPPRPTITVGDLEVGDTVFVRPLAGAVHVASPKATVPAVVTGLEPTPIGTVTVFVRTIGRASAVPARNLGQLPLTREFHLAKVAGRAPVAPTQNGNVVTVPASAQFSYRDNDSGSVLTAGPVTLLDDLHVSAAPNAGYSLDSGATAAWMFV